MIGKTVPRGAATLACILGLAACDGGSFGKHNRIAVALPEAELIELNGEKPIGTASLRGDPLVINFWATWCVPCRDEMPALEKLSQRIAAHRVRVVGISVDRDLNLAREFVRSRKLTFPIYADGKDNSLHAALSVAVLPETLLVAADGAIVTRITGMRDWNGAEGDRLLDQAFKLRLTSAR